jgi:hypothetical protein
MHRATLAGIPVCNFHAFRLLVDDVAGAQRGAQQPKAAP